MHDQPEYEICTTQNIFSSEICSFLKNLLKLKICDGSFTMYSTNHGQAKLSQFCNTKF